MREDGDSIPLPKSRIPALGMCLRGFPPCYRTQVTAAFACTCFHLKATVEIPWKQVLWVSQKLREVLNELLDSFQLSESVSFVVLYLQYRQGYEKIFLTFEWVNCVFSDSMAYQLLY